MKNLKTYILLHTALILYSFEAVFSKTAAAKPFLSLEFCIYYCFVLLIVGIYALLWQQILKNIPLNIAFANKAVTLIWGLVWGVLFFNETITVSNIAGAAIVLVGVLLIVTGGEKHHE